MSWLCYNGPYSEYLQIYAMVQNAFIARGSLGTSHQRRQLNQLKVAELKKAIENLVNLAIQLAPLKLPTLLIIELAIAAEPTTRCFDDHILWRIVETVTKTKTLV